MPELGGRSGRDRVAFGVKSHSPWVSFHHEIVSLSADGLVLTCVHTVGTLSPRAWLCWATRACVRTSRWARGPSGRWVGVRSTRAGRIGAGVRARSEERRVGKGG